MIELKTLKDLIEYKDKDLNKYNFGLLQGEDGYDATADYRASRKVADYEKLKQEVIKWIKYYRCNQYTEADHEFMKFFNITEEDLK